MTVQTVLVGKPKILIRNKGVKRIDNLYDRICDEQNIFLAYINARKGKGRTHENFPFITVIRAKKLGMGNSKMYYFT